MDCLLFRKKQAAMSNTQKMEIGLFSCAYLVLSALIISAWKKDVQIYAVPSAAQRQIKEAKADTCLRYF
jgi:hypothetical protein